MMLSCPEIQKRDVVEWRNIVTTGSAGVGWEAFSSAKVEACAQASADDSVSKPVNPTANLGANAREAFLNVTIPSTFLIAQPRRVSQQDSRQATQ
jgi:hypothetical protein